MSPEPQFHTTKTEPTTNHIEPNAIELPNIDGVSVFMGLFIVIAFGVLIRKLSKRD